MPSEKLDSIPLQDPNILSFLESWISNEVTYHIARTTKYPKENATSTLSIGTTI